MQRRFFASRPTKQTIPGQSVELAVTLRKDAPPVVDLPKAVEPEPEEVVVDADYLVIRYVFGPEDGRDLDTRTRVVTPLLAPVNYMGWYRDAWVSRPGGVLGSLYCQWGGDNTGTGVESVLIDVREFAAEFPESTLSIETRAFWFGERLRGNCDLTVDVYKGGVMSLANYEFVNLGGELVATVVGTYNVTNAVSDGYNDGDLLTHICYHIPSRVLSLGCTPGESGPELTGGSGCVCHDNDGGEPA